LARRWYQFSIYSLDPITRTLLRNNEPVDLTPKAAETLRVLLENSGTVVSKEDLMNRVWPGVFVEEGGLARNICALRRLFAKDDRNGFIQTIPRRGYRFLPSVQVTERPAQDKQRSLIVLPLKVLDNTADRDLGTRLTDALVTHLTALKHFRVSTMTAVDVADNGLQVYHNAEADYALQGTVQERFNRVRVTVQLVDIHARATAWAESFEEDSSDLFRMEDSFAEEICGAVALLMSTTERRLLSRDYTLSTEAYQLYLKGLFHWAQRSEGEVRRAISCFRTALGADPNYAPAHAALARSYAFLPMLSPVRSHAVMPKAKAAAISALDIDDGLAEARSALAFVKWHYDWNWEGAEKEFRRILKFQPAHALTYQWYALLLVEMGRFAEAEKEAALARSLDCSSSALANQATVFYLARKYNEALEAAHETLASFPGTQRAQLILGLSLEQIGKHDAATVELERAYRVSRRVPFVCNALGHAYAKSGRRREAESILRYLQNLRSGLVDFGSQSLIHVGLGNLGCALRLLDKACQEREFHVVLLKVDPRWDPIRLHPEFQAILKRIGLED
jgi:DNA-binding winged helix-turn-helix (wHTH) protein/tetratricopeptide (TPR) repeat protein